MLLSRGIARRREIAVRAALGASSGRIVWQMLNENFLLFLFGGSMGAICAMWPQAALIRLPPSDLPRTHNIRLDTTVLAFTLAVSVVTGLIFGLVPALGALRIDLRAALPEGSRTLSGSRLIGATRRSLLVGHIALAVVLPTTAGLLLKSFFMVLDRQAEFRTEHVLTFGVSLPQEQYPTVESTEAFYRELSRRLEQIPGLKTLGLGTDIPLGGHLKRLVSVDHPINEGKPVVDYTDAKGAYFQSLGLARISGRLFDDHDRQGSEPVAVVNEAFGRTFWPGKSALDCRVKLHQLWATCPGHVSSAWLATRSAASPARIGPHIYIPFEQDPAPQMKYVAWFALRTSGTALNLDHAVRNIVRSLDPSLPVLKLRSLEKVVSVAVAHEARMRGSSCCSPLRPCC